MSNNTFGRRIAVAALTAGGLLMFAVQTGCGDPKQPQQPTDHRARIAKAIELADKAAAAGKVDQAVQILANAIAAVPEGVPDRESIVMPARAKLVAITGGGAQPPSAAGPPPASEPPQGGSANVSPAPPPPPPAAQQDVTVAPLAPTPPPAGGAIEPQPPVGDTQAPERHDRFLQFRQAGLDAMERKDYPAAVGAFQQALQNEDDAKTFEMLQFCVDKTQKPRIAVLDFDATGEVGIPDAGRSVAQLLLVRFGPQRFQLIERTHLADILAEQDLTMSAVAGNPAVLGAKKLRTVQFLVVGSVVRLGELSVAARLVDVATGEIVQTAEVSADDPQELQDVLSDLAAMLQMSADEKIAFLQQRRADAEHQAQLAAMMDAAQRAQRQRELQQARQQEMAAQAAWQERQRQAFLALADARALMARGEFARAGALSRAALRDFADTAAAAELAAIYEQSQRELAYDREASQRQLAHDEYRRQMEARRHHEEFLKHRQAAAAALDAGDLRTAIAELKLAMDNEDDEQTRSLLAAVIERSRRPGVALAVVDVDDPQLAGYGQAWGRLLVDGFSTERYRIVENAELLAAFQARKLSPRDLWDQPQLLRGLRLPARYIIVARVTKTSSYDVQARLIDADTGAFVQTSELYAQDSREIQVVWADAARILQCDERQKKQYVERIGLYPRLMTKGREAAEAGKWQEAFDAYGSAYRITPTQQAKAGMENAARKLAETQDKAKRYAAAIADARKAIDRKDYAAASRALELAASIDPNGAEVRELSAKVAPALVVLAELDGRPYSGAIVKVDGRQQPGGTPLTVAVRRGSDLELSVSIPPAGQKVYSSFRKTIRVDWYGPRDIKATLKDITPQTTTRPLTPFGPVTPTATAAPTVPVGTATAPLPTRPAPAPAGPTGTRFTPPPTASTKPAPAAPPSEVKPPASVPAGPPGRPLPPTRPSGPTPSQLRYDSLVEQARAALSKEQYPAAEAAIDEALTIKPDGQEAKALAQRLTPTLLVTSLLDGKPFEGAKIVIDDKVRPVTTPASITLQRGKTYKVEVTIESGSRKVFSTASTTISADRPGPQKFVAQITTIGGVVPPKAPVAPSPAVPIVPATAPTGSRTLNLPPPTVKPAAPAPASRPAVTSLPATAPAAHSPALSATGSPLLQGLIRPAPASQPAAPAPVVGPVAPPKGPTMKPVTSIPAPPLPPPPVTAQTLPRETAGQYSKLISQATAAIEAKRYDTAEARLRDALALAPAGKEAKDLLDKLQPTLEVTLTLGGKRYVGPIKLTVDDREIDGTAPFTMPLTRGQKYEIAVTIPPGGGKTYTAARTSITVDRLGPQEFKADLKQAK
jgi:hypothetical protein